MRSNIVDVEVSVIAETERAIKVRPNFRKGEAVWLPKSAVEIDRVVGGEATISLPEALAIEKGLV